MYVCMYVSMYVCRYVGMYVHTYVHTYVRMCVCMYVCMYVLMYVCMNVCMHIYVCVCVCVCVCGQNITNIPFTFLFYLGIPPLDFISLNSFSYEPIEYRHSMRHMFSWCSVSSPTQSGIAIIAGGCEKWQSLS